MTGVGALRNSVPIVGLGLVLGCGSEPDAGSRGSDSDTELEMSPDSLGALGDPTSSGGSDAITDCEPKLTGIVRDFRGFFEEGGHPDFEVFAGDAASHGIVEVQLGPDKKPVYARSGPMINHLGRQQTTSPDAFHQWYRDMPPVNQSIEYTIELSPGASGLAIFDDPTFFPIDGMLFGDYPDILPGEPSHNFHFTFELHTRFLYRGGEIFTFTGDDDLWVFIHDRLAIDLGGLHPELSESVELDRIAGEFGLIRGETYDLDLFHAERHTTDSHFRIETSIEFTHCEPILLR